MLNRHVLRGFAIFVIKSYMRYTKYRGHLAYCINIFFFPIFYVSWIFLHRASAESQPNNKQDIFIYFRSIFIHSYVC